MLGGETKAGLEHARELLAETGRADVSRSAGLPARTRYNDRDMLDLLLKKIFGTKHERDVKRMQPLVVSINAFEESLQGLSDAELTAKTDEFRRRLAAAAASTTCSPRSSRWDGKGSPMAGDAAFRRAAHRRHGSS